MGTLAASVLTVLFFLIAFHVLGLIAVARGALSQSRGAVAVMRDGDLSEDDKEAAVRRAALWLLRSTVSIIVRSVACLLISAIPVYALAAIGVTTPDDVLAFLSRWDVILISSALIAAGMYWGSRRGAPSGGYSAMDRTVHRLAFARPGVQLSAADLEDSVFGGDVANVPDRPPLFVTSLPRAGTTVMLTALHGVPGVATHLYRDMPFVMAPLLWSRLSGAFAKPGGVRERAHGDGIEVGYDSPEAFEEVIWRAFWPDNYHPGRIDLWREDDARDEATAFFRRHFRKIVALRCGGEGRYVSKNNGNIARLDLLPAMFPGAHVVVPLRDPLEHAASLLRQHQNFAEQHAHDPFVKRYMRDIGHLEFGELHTPIAFAGFADLADGLGPTDPDYWLAYWIAGNRAILARAGDLHLVPQGLLGDRPEPVMERLCRDVGLDPQGRDVASHFRPIATRTDPGRFDPGLLSIARDLDAALQAASTYRP